MRIAYFTNQYPAVSHTFIRREIRALEAQGTIVVRYALRKGSQELVDQEDWAELKKTCYVLEIGIGALIQCLIFTLLRQPAAVAKIVWLAIKVGWRSDRGVLRHFAYVVEATVLAHWCRRDAIQHLHAHFGTNPTVVAMLASQLADISYSFTAHGSEEFEKAPMLSLDEKLLRAEFAVCVSSFGKSQLMRWCPPELWRKVEVVHCGVDTSYLDSPIQKPSSARRFVCAGRLGEHKAQLVLVAAAVRLHNAGIDFEVVLVGDGPMRPLVEEAIRQAGLENKITITGWVSGERVKAEIIAGRVFVLPSFSENMPVVIMEAMALGRPVISTYIAGIPEMVQPGHTGWLVPAGDDRALAEAMRDALAASDSELAIMGAAARSYIIDNHDVGKETKKLSLLFENSV